ncbi:MAG: transglycosylase SLT domain-containing protein [Xanthomonadales bacterium]|nr:transglycosylase SLT domain-containing protein [Xanthomonadales bacterium]
MHGVVACASGKQPGEGGDNDQAAADSQQPGKKSCQGAGRKKNEPVDLRVLPVMALAICMLLWNSIAGATLEQQRTAYKAARAAIHRGQDTVVDMMLPGLVDYPLYPYLIHERLRRHLATVDADEIRAFLDRYDELPVTLRLRSRWLRILARRGEWGVFRAEDDPRLDDAELRCFRLQARLAAGETVPFDTDTRDLWYVGESQEDACDPIFDHWRQRGLLDERTDRERIKLAIQAGQYSLARYLARNFPDPDRRLVETWIGAFTRPGAVLARWPGGDADDDLLAAAMKRVARADSDLAYGLWPAVEPQLAGNASLLDSVRREMALFRATDYAPDAANQLDRLSTQARDQQILEWRLRVALVDSDWETALKTIARMEPEHRGRGRWRYWRARSLEELGMGEAAEREYRALAQDSDYYGFMAADRLDRSYQLCPQDGPVQVSWPQAIEAALVRALELFHVDQRIDATREWRHALNGVDESAGVDAALRASRAGWHHQAILTLADFGALTRYEPRFPLVWTEIVEDAARAEKLPPSLIYAVMRSESALRPDAVSGAGAMGLMQLTPDTARRVGQRNGIRVRGRRALFDPELNIRLGAAYLRELYVRFQHPLLVLAAYNAGPEAVERWLTEDRLPETADVWIETLPYFETRDYIPRVLAFQSIYEWRMAGRMTRLRGNMFELDKRSGKPVWRDVPRSKPRCDSG